MNITTEGMNTAMLLSVFCVFVIGCDGQPPTSEDTKAASSLVGFLLSSGINAEDKQHRLPTKDEMKNYPPPYLGMDADGDGAFSDLGDISHMNSIPSNLKAKSYAEANTVIVRALQNTRIVDKPGIKVGIYRRRIDESWVTFVNIRTKSVSSAYFLADHDQFYTGEGNWSEKLRNLLSDVAPAPLLDRPLVSSRSAKAEGNNVEPISQSVTPDKPESSSAVRKWTDSSGKHELLAELVGFDDSIVSLKKNDGSIVTLSIDQLSPEDQAFVRATSTVSNPSNLATGGGLRKWTDISGKHTVVARFDRFEDGLVYLTKENGDETNLPIERLGSADQHYVRSLVDSVED